MEVDGMLPLAAPCSPLSAPTLALVAAYKNAIDELLSSHCSLTQEQEPPMVVEGVIPILGQGAGDACELVVFLRGNSHLEVGPHMNNEKDLQAVHDYLRDGWQATGLRAPLLYAPQLMYPRAELVAFLKSKHDLKLVGAM